MNFKRRSLTGPRPVSASETGRLRGFGFGLLIAVSLFGITDGRAQDATIRFDPDTGEFDCNESWTVEVVIDDSVADLRGFSLILEFDPSVIRPLSVSPGGLVTGAACPNFFRWLNSTTFTDSIEIDGATLGCSVAGPGSIITLVFEGYLEGTSYIRCRSGLLRDGLNQPVDLDCEEATVTYLCAVATSHLRWSALKAIYN